MKIPVSTIPPAERTQRTAENACVPAKDLRALIDALIQKGVITEADLTARKGRD